MAASWSAFSMARRPRATWPRTGLFVSGAGEDEDVQVQRLSPGVADGEPHASADGGADGGEGHHGDEVDGGLQVLGEGDNGRLEGAEGVDGELGARHLERHRLAPRLRRTLDRCLTLSLDLGLRLRGGDAEHLPRVFVVCAGGGVAGLLLAAVEPAGDGEAALAVVEAAAACSVEQPCFDVVAAEPCGGEAPEAVRGGVEGVVPAAFGGGGEVDAGRFELLRGPRGAAAAPGVGVDGRRPPGGAAGEGGARGGFPLGLLAELALHERLDGLGAHGRVIQL